MPTRRGKLAESIAQLVGPSLQVVQDGDGWPSAATLNTPGGNIPLGLHVSTVSPHARRDYEVRFQNPGAERPVKDDVGFPLLVGLAQHAPGQHQIPILIGVDGTDRVGRHARFSILFNRSIITEAANFGIATYESKSGEKIHAFRPKLFSSFVEIIRGGEVPSPELQAVVQASGFEDEPSDAAAERSRRAVSMLVRHHSFGRRVKAAYGGRCCLCGIGVGLVTGAHLYPASAPGSPDTVRNGAALCPNHHTAFDNHDLWIDPNTLAVRFSPRLLADAAMNAGTQHFVQNTSGHMRPPAQPAQRPDPAMLTQRYAYYVGRYDWAN